MSDTLATINITGDIGTGYVIGGKCDCVEATEEEVLAALAETDALPALAVDGDLLAVDDDILMI